MRSCGSSLGTASGEQSVGMALSRQSRLCGPKEFSRVFEQAVVSADSGFKVLGCLAAQPNSRLGMAVSREVDKRAVQRNRLKRLIRESFRSHYLSDPARCPPVDIVVLPRRLAVAASNEQLFDQLSSHWARIDERLENAKAGTKDRAKRGPAVRHS